MILRDPSMRKDQDRRQSYKLSSDDLISIIEDRPDPIAAAEELFKNYDYQLWLESFNDGDSEA
jgi:hypothetical protein